MSSTQPMHQPANDRPLRVLSLDAGGVHSLSTISMLMRLMGEFNKLRPETKDFEPWKVFDMIGGVETGGLLAIMLGRLRWSPAKCGDKFKAFCEKIYQPKGPNQEHQEPADPAQDPIKFDSEVLEKAVFDMGVGQYGWADDTLRNKYIPCKVCVVLNRSDANIWNILSTYSQSDDTTYPSLTDCKTSQVCVAMTASPGLFDAQPLTKYAQGSGTYCPGDRVANPVNFVAKEFKEQFPGREALVISIGSGVKARATTGTITSVDKILDNNPGVFKKSMLLSINNDNDMRMSNIPKDDPNAWDEIRRAVNAYMSDEATNRKFEECAKQLNLAHL